MKAENHTAVRRQVEVLGSELNDTRAGQQLLAKIVKNRVYSKQGINAVAHVS